MWQPIYQLEPNRHYGYALHVTPDYQQWTLVEHGGSQVGVSAYFGFIPQRRLVAAVLTNVTDVPADRLWSGAINTALGLPVDYSVRVLPQGPLQLPAERYTGRYTSKEGACVDVEEREGQLMATGEEGTFPLLGGREHCFAYQRQGTLRRVKFYVRPGEERAWALLWGLRMLQKRAPE